jgi:delta(3,5)-delta(2,4)-dienoyl-CoA isomerase
MMKAAFKLAGVIAAKSPVATLGIKNVLNFSRDHTVAEGLNYVALWNASAIKSKDVLIAMSSKTPIFSKL